MKLLDLNNKKILHFKFKKLNSGKFFLSNDLGKRIILEEKVFRNFIEGKKINKKIETELINKYFLTNNKLSDFQQKSMAGYWLNRHQYLLHGPSLHIIVLTKNCNYNCIYCHASAQNNKNFHLNKVNAKKYVDIIFETTSTNISIEFQGGEPLLNFDVLKYIVKYAKQKNLQKKIDLNFSVVSNLSIITDDIIDYFIKEGISISTSIDGPKKLHDYNRKHIGGKSSHELTTNNLIKIQKKYKEKGLYTQLPGAVTTITKESLKYPKEIVKEFIRLGLPNIFIRPLNPFGYAKDIWEKISYTNKQYLEFYKKFLNEIKKQNKNKTKIQDTYTELILKSNLNECCRINFMEERIPCGAGLGQLAYDRDGKIYTCDEGRMLGATNDFSFMLADVTTEKDSKEIYKKIINNTITKIMAYSSYLEGIPGYNTHPYISYIGSCPIYSYCVSNNIISKYRNEGRFNIQEGIMDEIIDGTKI